MKLNNNIKTAFIAVVATLVTIFLVKTFTGTNGTDVIFNTADGKTGDSMVTLANLPAGIPGDFTYAAEVSTPSVVHIKAITERTTSSRRPSSIFEQFFGFDEDFNRQPRSQNQESSGSGVIISKDGYIVTNNHVIEGTNSLEVVTSNKKSYTAKIIGRDPSTDIAVIKIDEDNLPAMTFGNSDGVKIGEWVLAVGNPFNLESTVTAGIISAIGRNINILGRQRNQGWPGSMSQQPEEQINPIESFIQTDAAVNPGNSGGALVNLNGQLIGINTAIASPNGSYAGYAFAVPSGIVKKVASDIIKFGDVQRGYAGIEFIELNNKNATELESKNENGIYVNNVTEGGAADAAGIKKGDVILQADGIATMSGAKFSELIGRKRPGEKVQFVLDRNGSKKNISITLKDTPDGKAPAKKDPSLATAYGKMGLELTDLSKKELEQLGINSGVKVTNLRKDGLVATKTNIDKGFIITTLGNIQVKTAKEVQNIINSADEKGEEGILICGFYPNGPRGCDGIPIR